MRRTDFAVLTVSITLLLCATVPWIGHLGLEYDEAHFLPLAVKIAHGAEERIELPWGFTAAGRPIPFVTMPYVGTLDAFVYAVPYRIFGSSRYVSRGTNLLLAALIFGLVWWIARRESGTWAAAGALALLLVDVEWVLHVPTHFGPFLLQQLLALAAIAFLQQWWRTGRGILFFAAVAMLALAFHEKLTFLWILSSLSLGIVLFQAKLTWRQSRWWYYPAGSLLAVAIVSPILYFAYAVPEVILGFGKASAKIPADWGRLAADRWQVFDLMLRGNWSIDFTVGASPVEPHRGPALLILFFAGLASAIHARQRLALILYTTAMGVWVWNLAFPDAGRMHHMLLMAPFWQVAAAIAIQAMARPAQVLSILLLLWSGLDSSRSYLWYAGEAQRTGGINHWSDMTSRAVEWFDAHPSFEPVTTSWGVARPLSALSGGRLNPVEHYFDTAAEPLSVATISELTQLIHKERQAWLVSNVMPPYEVQWQKVVQLARGEGKQPFHLNTFYSRDGRHQIAAYTFTLSKPVPAHWTAVQGAEFLVDSGQFRMELSGRAVEDFDSLSVLWLDAAGKTTMTDSRNFHWAPHIQKSSTLYFSTAYWPATFTRQRQSTEPPRKVRVLANFRNASIIRIEVPAL